MTSMVLVAATVVLGLVLGYVLGGRIANLNDVRLRWGWTLAVAVLAQLVLTVLALVSGEIGPVVYPLLFASHVALFAFVWSNRRLPGMTLIFLGFALNATVIAANGAMPVSPEALERAGGGAVEDIEELEPGKHRLLQEGDRLAVLADVLPVPLLRTVVSVGDILLAAGVCVLVVSLMRGDPATRRRAPPSQPGRHRHR